MKTQVLFAVLTALVFTASGSVIQSQSDVEPPQVLEFQSVVKDTPEETFNLIIGVVSHQDRILHRVYCSKPAVANVVQTEDVLYRAANPNVKISYISALAIGSTSTAYAQIIRGGYNDNNVNIRLSSTSGSGYQFMIEIWGH